MKLVIDEAVCSNFDVTLEEVLVSLLLKFKVNNHKILQDLYEKGYVVDGVDGNYKLSKYFEDRVTQILLASDKEVPSDERCENLAVQMRALYPRGNSSSGYPWRGNLRDLTKRLKKFFKLYGNWTDEEIIDATQRYISHYNGDYTYMRILKYFILKSDKGEEGSDLATWLENDTEVNNDDWLNEVR